MFGRLTLKALKHEPSQMLAVIMMTLTGIGLIALITYLKRWKWLWNEWLTTVDPQKNWHYVYRRCSLMLL